MQKKYLLASNLFTLPPPPQLPIGFLFKLFFVFERLKEEGNFKKKGDKS